MFPEKKESGQGTGGFQAGRRRMLFWKKKRGPLSCLIDMNHGKTENKLKEAALHTHGKRLLQECRY